MKNLFSYLSILLVVFCSACKKDPTPPKLTLNQTEFNLPGGTFSGKIEIINEGEEELLWELDNKNNEIEFDVLSGQLSKSSEFVTFRVNELLFTGEYSLTFSVKSNAGEIDLTVNLSIPERAGIFPGQGIYRTSLNSTNTHIVSLYGSPDETYSHYYKEYNLYLNEANYPNQGVVLLYISETKTIKPTDKVVAIMLFDPNKEETEEGINLRTSAQDLTNTFGQSEIETYDINEKSVDTYQYSTKGISITYYSNNLSRPWFIEIYDPFDPDQTKMDQFNTPHNKDEFTLKTQLKNYNWTFLRNMR